MTEPTDDAPTLPGLESPPRPPAPLEAAVRRTLLALAQEGLVEERHAARLQLALELSAIITTKRQSGRLSTVANDARVLMELLDKLLPTEESGVDELLRAAMEKWSREVDSGFSADAGAEIRDQA